MIIGYFAAKDYNGIEMPKGLWWIVEIAALCAFLAIPLITIAHYGDLPGQIPTHFGIHGRPDGYGDKSTLLVLLAVDCFVFALISIAPFRPELINMPGPRTERALQAGVAMLRLLKLEVMIFMAYVTWGIVQTAQGHAGGLGAVAPLLFVFALLATLGAGFYVSTRNVN